MRIFYTFLIATILLSLAAALAANVYASASVDHMRITVYYTPSAGPASGTTMMMGMEL